MIFVQINEINQTRNVKVQAVGLHIPVAIGTGLIRKILRHHPSTTVNLCGSLLIELKRTFQFVFVPFSSERYDRSVVFLALACSC